MSGYFLLIGLFWLVFPQSHGTFFEDQIRLGAGLHFKTLNKAIIPSSGAINLFFTIPTPRHPPAPDFSTTGQTTGKLPADVRANQDRINALYININRIYNDLISLLKGFTPVKSQKRGLINAVGSLGKSLFGFATEADIKQIYTHLAALKRDSISDTDMTSKLQAGVKELRDHFQTLASYVNDTITSTNSIHRQLGAFQHLLDSFQSVQGSTTRQLWNEIFIHGLRILTLQHQTLYQSCLNDLVNWRTALLSLQQGKIPPYLIPYSAIQQGLRQLKTTLQSTHGKAFQIKLGPYYEALYYDVITARTRVFEHHLLITAHVPLFTSPDIFDAYKLNPIPNPVPSGTKTSSAYTILQNLPDYILISRNNQAYIELTEKQYSNCVGTHFTICANVLQSQAIHSPSCTSAIYFEQQETINRLCSLSITNKPIIPSIEYIGNSRFLLVNNTRKNHIMCPDQNIRYLVPAISQVIRLGCGCRLTLDTDVLSSTVTSCSSNITVDVAHPLNTPVLYHFQANLPDSLSPSLANTSDPSSASFHELQDLHTALTQIEEKDLAFHTDLERLDPDNLFDSITQPEYTAGLEHTLYTIFIALEGLCIIISGLVLVWTFLKINMLQEAILALSTDAAAAQTSLLDGWHTRVPNLLWIIAFIMVAYMLIWALKLCMPYLHRLCTLTALRHCPGICRTLTDTQLDVFLKLSAGQDQALVFLTTLHLENGHSILMQAPRCTKVTVNNGVLTSSLQITWLGELIVKTNSHPGLYYLPRNVQISSTMGRVLTRALNAEDRIYNLQYKLADSPLTAIPHLLPEGGLPLSPTSPIMLSPPPSPHTSRHSSSIALSEAVSRV